MRLSGDARTILRNFIFELTLAGASGRWPFGVNLSLEMVVEEDPHPLSGVVCISGSVATFIIGVLEGVAGIGINFYIDRLAERLHGCCEVVDVLRGNSLV